MLVKPHAVTLGKICPPGRDPSLPTYAMVILQDPTHPGEPFSFEAMTRAEWEGRILIYTKDNLPGVFHLEWRYQGTPRRIRISPQIRLLPGVEVVFTPRFPEEITLDHPGDTAGWPFCFRVLLGASLLAFPKWAKWATDNQIAQDIYIRCIPAPDRRLWSES